MQTQFNNIVLSVLAFKAGEAFSKAHNVAGNEFLGGFNVADKIGFDRESLEWKQAVNGAMSHITTLEVITDAEGKLI